LILIKLKGAGTVFMKVGGEVTMINLRKGQKIRIDTSNIAAFDSSVDYDVERVAGIK
jgi:uncharacterized protein (AIM24 family)